MMILDSGEILSKLDLAEDTFLEIKEALGRDGKGELPNSFFQTYSAMANTDGGTVLLGIKEKPKDKFTVQGIKNTGRVVKKLWDDLNNRTKVSHNLLTNQMVSILTIDSKLVIKIEIPKAKAFQRPIFLGLNPLSGTYRRNHEGDYLCDAEIVKRMLSEQIEPIRDSKLLTGFDFDDLDTSTLLSYRKLFSATKPDHPWIDCENKEFLRMIGGWSKCRDTGQEGLTLAGLLMFGTLPSIYQAVPNYILDYQERREVAAERWVDRITTDGTWAGNLFQFYRMVISRLTSDLKIPFKLNKEQRIDETPIHEALREAFINAMIHADYSDRVSILILKRPDMFGFRNPGLMRVKLEDALLGGTSDCRNRTIQKMFQLVGWGEQAGSGIPKIWHNWRQQQWRLPTLSEHLDPDQTILTLKMVTLLPEHILDSLEKKFPGKMQSLSTIQQTALAYVSLDGFVTHSQLKNTSVEHPRDITLALASLVRDALLESSSVSKTTYYYFPGEPPKAITTFEEEMGFGSKKSSVPFIESSSTLSSVPLGESSVPLGKGSVPSEEQLAYMNAIAERIKGKKKVQKETMRAVIVELCQKDYVSLRVLAETLNRSPDYLRIKHLNDLVSSGRLHIRFPDTPSHPHQAYKSTNV